MDGTQDLPGKSLPPASLAFTGRAHDALFAAPYADLKPEPLGPTTLLHEAYLQLAGRDSSAFADPRELDRISDALDSLAVLQPELARVVDLRFFCGFTMAEISLQCGLSERTVQRQWHKARALLYAALRAR